MQLSENIPELSLWSELSLQWVNRLRSQFDLGNPLDNLKPGYVSQANECVIAKSLGEGWTVSMYHGVAYVSNELVKIQAPAYVADFITAFDAYWYPHLLQNEYEDAYDGAITDLLQDVFTDITTGVLD